MTAATVLVYLYLILHNCVQNPRKGIPDELRMIRPLKPLLENLRKYLHKPYTARN